MDTKPLAGSMNPITSDAVYEALEGKLGIEGGALTGPLELAGDPEEANQAATKGYVDSHGGGGANKALDNLVLPLEWGASDYPDPAFLEAIYWDAGKGFLGVSEYDTIMTSTDGENWEYPTAPWESDATTAAICCANDMVLCAIKITESNKYSTYVTFADSMSAVFSNEQPWNAVEEDKRNLSYLYSAYFNGGYYVALSNKLYVSFDKESFSEVTLPTSVLTGGRHALRGMVSNNNALILLYTDSAQDLPDIVIYTKNGTTWETHVFADDNNYRLIATNGDIIVTVPYNQTLDVETAYYTINGDDWFSVPFDYIGANLLISDGTRFLAMENAKSSAMVSYDGTTWEAVTLPIIPEAVTAGNGLFVVANITNSEYVITTAPTKTYKNLLPVLNMVKGTDGNSGSNSNVVIDEGQTAGEIAEALKAIIESGGAPVLLASGYSADIVQYSLGGWEWDNDEIVGITMVGVEKKGTLDSSEYAYINTRLFAYADYLWSKTSASWRVAATLMP